MNWRSKKEEVKIHFQSKISLTRTPEYFCHFWWMLAKCWARWMDRCSWIATIQSHSHPFIAIIIISSSSSSHCHHYHHPTSSYFKLLYFPVINLVFMLPWHRLHNTIIIIMTMMRRFFCRYFLPNCTVLPINRKLHHTVFQVPCVWSRSGLPNLSFTSHILQGIVIFLIYIWTNF